MNGSQSVLSRKTRENGAADADLASALAPLASRLNLFGEIVDVAKLHPAIERIHVIQRDQPSWAERNHGERVFVLESGFAFAFSLFPDGRRHIADIFAAGSICNWSNVWGGLLVENVTFKARSRVLAFDRERLMNVLAEQRTLREAIERHETARIHRRQQRCRGLISLPASDRLALALLDIQDELGMAGPRDEWLSLPITLRELGDLTGLTDVHVSRTMRKLQDAGFIEKRGKLCRLDPSSKVAAGLDYHRFFAA